MVFGFPCNQFLNQEPGTEAEIKAFAQSKFGVTFPLFSKCDVNGASAHPLFKHLKSSLPGGELSCVAKWILCKSPGDITWFACIVFQKSLVRMFASK